MVDFFIEINSSPSPLQQDEFIFPTEMLFDKNYFFHKKIISDKIRVFAIDKTADFSSIFENDNYIVLVYGYCYTRLSSNDNNKRRYTAESLLSLYILESKKITAKIKGSYSLIIYEKRNSTVEIFTDELNLKTVYYSSNTNKLYLSSSLSAFIHYSNKDFGKVNYKSLIEYSMFDFVLTNETFIENVYTIPPASIYRFENGTIAKEQFWNIFNELEKYKPDLNEKESIKQCESLLKSNLKLYLNNAQETAFALTGGYDSRTNLALLPEINEHTFFYSYGIKESYDIKFAQKVAKALKLNYHAFILDEKFNDSFSKHAEIAIGLGDGLVEMNRANYSYVYKELSQKYSSILTGLFGSELIKRPTSYGSYIDKNIHSLLLSENIKSTFRIIVEQEIAKSFIKPEIIKKYEAEILDDILNCPYLNNSFETARKFFYFIVGQGIRMYFMKEIKVERAFVENLHPFLDIEFIQLLLQTPFPWLYNWKIDKSLYKNLKIHRFYAQLIFNNNKKLANIPSTHAYSPKYLLNKLYLPLLIVQYAFYRRKIKKAGIFKNESLILNFYTQNKNLNEQYNSFFINQNLEKEFKNNQKDFAKLISLQYWLKKNNLSLEQESKTS